MVYQCLPTSDGNISKIANVLEVEIDELLKKNYLSNGKIITNE
jgi:hypothetical protein